MKTNYRLPRNHYNTMGKKKVHLWQRKKVKFLLTRKELNFKSSLVNLDQNMFVFITRLTMMKKKMILPTISTWYR